LPDHEPGKPERPAIAGDPICARRCRGVRGAELSLHFAGDDVVVSLKRRESASVLVVRGCVDAENVHVLRDQVNSAAGLPGDVVVDLSDVSFFSSAGAAVLSAASRVVRVHVVVTPLIREVLRAAGADDSLHLHDFPAEAEEVASRSAADRRLLLVG
jgi:anti-anti-sigma factor